MPKEKILIVDNEPSTLHLTVDALANEGYAVKGTSSGHDALAMLEEERFDLLVTDVVIPEVDGLELLRRARDIDRDIIAIIMTDYGTIDITIESLKAGAQSFLVKPSSIQELRATIKETLEKSCLARENVRLKALLPLFEVSKALISEVKVDRLFNLIVQTVSLETKADRVSLMLLDEATQELTIKAAVGLPQDIIANATEKIGEGIAGSVAKTGKPLILDDGRKLSQPLKKAMRQTGVLSALCVPLMVKGKVIGILNSSKTSAGNPFTESDLELLSILAGEAAIAIENAKLFSNVKAQQVRLEQLLARLLNAQEDERRRISAEIHDSVAQWMVNASYRIQSCGALLSESRTDEASDEISHIRSTIEQSIKELRRIITDLHPPALNELGLVQALRQNVGVLQKETGIACHFQAEGAPDQLSSSQEIAIYRVVQEALNNVRKHAGATELNVRLQFCPDEVFTEVRDNGKGFDLSQTMDSVSSGRMGLLSMKDRAEMLGGSLKIETGIWLEPELFRLL